MRLLVTDADDPLMPALYAGINVDYQARYGSGGATYAARDDAAFPGQFRAPLGGVVLLVDGDRAVAAAAYTRHDAGTARVKRVWTDPTRRRQGLSRRVLAELESVVRRQGYTGMVLTTGRKQPEAVALYLATGWVEQPGLDVAEPDERAFTKRLQVARDEHGTAE